MTLHGAPALTAAELGERLGLRRFPRSWRGECPACGYAGTFTVKPGQSGRPMLFCASCGDRDALAEAVTRRLGEGWRAGPGTVQSSDDGGRVRRQEAADRLWRGSEPAPGTPVATYVASRGLAGLERSAALRFRDDASHPEAGGRWPCMVAQVVDADGRPMGVHRTYLAPDGRGKANIEPAKATLAAVWGGAVRLDPLAAELVIGEGIESAASAGRMLGLPAWAALSAGNLGSGLVLPVGVRSVVIAADRDPATRDGKHPGQDAAAQAAARWRAEGRHVRIAMPDRVGDFNDVLRAEVSGG